MKQLKQVDNIHLQLCLSIATIVDFDNSLQTVMRYLSFLRELNELARPVHYSGAHSSLPLTL